MSEKRCDSKNRILRTGESQRTDGRYAYKYTDTFGKPQFICAWKLVPTDKTPAGKRDDLSLREKIKEMQKDLDDGIDAIGKKMTVCQLYAKQNRHRGNVRKNTVNRRKRLMSIFEQDKLGACSIDSVKMSDAKEWALRMKERGLPYKTIRNDKRSLKAVFYSAIQDDCIRKNPFDFQLNTVLEDDTEPKAPLTPAQETELLSSMQNDVIYQKYYDDVIILLGTGLRISELCGLTDTDLDFENKVINADRQLLYGTEGYYVETPKTKSGIRQIPMSAKVYEALQRVMNARRSAEQITVDGYSNFIFLNRNGKPKTAASYGSMFRGLAKKYNKCHEEALPKVMTPHTPLSFPQKPVNTGFDGIQEHLRGSSIFIYDFIVKNMILFSGGGLLPLKITVTGGIICNLTDLHAHDIGGGHAHNTICKIGGKANPRRGA